MQKFSIYYKFLFVNWPGAKAAKSKIFWASIIGIAGVLKVLKIFEIRKIIARKMKVFIKKM